MASIEPIVLYIENENKIKLVGLIDDLGSYVNNAVVTITVVDGRNNVVNGILNQTMSSSSQTGDYIYIVLATGFSPQVGNAGYRAIISAVVSGVPKYKVYKPIVMAQRVS